MTARTILITGCSSGIGLASARVMSARGWHVIATARKDDDLAMLRADLKVDAVHLELGDMNSVAACAERALTLSGGRIDALFNNAAYGQAGAVEDLSVDLLRRQFEVNLFAQHELIRRILPAMRRQGHGRIVQCSSVLGLVAAPWRGAYCASKFAMEGLTDSMRIELAGSGIHISLIEPGPIRTRFVENALSNFLKTIDIPGSVHRAAYEARVERMKLGRNEIFKLEPEAVAAKLVHAVESARPKKRYYVTKPTYFAAMLKRVAPQGTIDWFVQKM
jgi:NAD(P)-dependent dehydrogenase (short-subunit alcohol dehydrogenase family)